MNRTERARPRRGSRAPAAMTLVVALLPLFTAGGAARAQSNWEQYPYPPEGRDGAFSDEPGIPNAPGVRGGWKEEGRGFSDPPGVEGRPGTSGAWIEELIRPPGAPLCEVLAPDGTVRLVPCVGTTPPYQSGGR